MLQKRQSTVGSFDGCSGIRLKNVFLPRSGTQKRWEGKERLHMEDCQVAEERSNHRKDYVALLVHSLDRGSLSRRGVLVVWWGCC